ncbi:thiopeptide-type bacteriocin biosynthesis protein [Chryseobacterium daeguense]|uniref:thiopeptide-type bacteriocin biosynthesis protein n=1 Tax=Chryseobacterium daeguense TaxID=412438 RepID=UPI000410394D|nr:thiopeptide-type bacteriocin biosynthesis protein [Chryseobacterium daeguense]
MKRKFIPGSEWLYLKIYTGVKTADLVLSDSIMPLVEFLTEKRLIKKWFFIRYNDPKPHLRLRFELAETGNYDTIILKINTALEKYMDSGEISNFLIDTYNREIERYGEQTINEAEYLFYKNSELIVKEYLDFDDEEKLIVSVFYIDQILGKLGLSIEEKLKWIEDSNRAFKQEFNADKTLNAQLDKKYRAFKIKYSDFLDHDEYKYFRDTIISETDSLNETIKIISKKSDNILLQRFFESIFHMNINRLFISNQRVFEMVIYDYMYRYYKSECFKIKA